MIGLGTIINVAAIIIGGLCGLFLGRGVKVRYQDILMMSVGIGDLGLTLLVIFNSFRIGLMKDN